MSKEVDQKQTGGGEEEEEGGLKEIRSNHFKYHLCPSVKRGGAPRLERSVLGTEVLVRAGTQWGRGEAIRATTNPPGPLS